MLSDFKSPCDPIFGCPNQNVDRNFCSYKCGPLAVYRSYLDKFANFANRADFDCEGDVSISSLPLADPEYTGVVDEYSSLVAFRAAGVSEAVDDLLNVGPCYVKVDYSAGRAQEVRL